MASSRASKPEQPEDPEFARFREMLDRYEPLRPELHSYLQRLPHDTFIRHPFCNMPIHDLDRCAHIHHIIDERTAAADACFEDQDWEGYLGSIEISRQPEWFVKDAPLLPDDRYWTLLSTIYQNQTVTFANRNRFDALFRADRPGREHLMTEKERAVLARLPDRLDVYRGYSQEEMYADGVAWTLDRRQAIWYANRMRDEDPMLASGVIFKDRVWAYLDGGDILLPSEAVEVRRDVPAFDDAARVAWADFVKPRFDVNKLLVAQS
jgi:hypothetical protein